MKASSPAPVQYRLDASGLQRWGVFVVVAIEALLVTFWILFQREASYASWSFWAAVLLVAAGLAFFAWHSLQKLPAGWLLWTGAVWRLQEAVPDMKKRVQAGTPFLKCALVFDGQHCMLLRLSQTEPNAVYQTAQWVWVSRTHMPEHWHALRCAVIWAQSVSLAPVRL